VGSSRYDGIATGIIPALVRTVDAFYPIVSLLAFLSGACFGCYFAWRGQLKQDVAARADRKEPVALRKAA